MLCIIYYHNQGICQASPAENYIWLEIKQFDLSADYIFFGKNGSDASGHSQTLDHAEPKTPADFLMSMRGVLHPNRRKNRNCPAGSLEGKRRLERVWWDFRQN